MTEDSLYPSPDDLLTAWEARMKKRIEEEEAQAAKEAAKLREAPTQRRDQPSSGRFRV